MDVADTSEGSTRTGVANPRLVTGPERRPGSLDRVSLSADCVALDDLRDALNGNDARNLSPARSPLNVTVVQIDSQSPTKDSVRRPSRCIEAIPSDVPPDSLWNTAARSVSLIAWMRARATRADPGLSGLAIGLSNRFRWGGVAIPPKSAGGWGQYRECMTSSTDWSGVAQTSHPFVTLWATSRISASRSVPAGRC